MAFPEVKFGICERCGRRGVMIDSDTGASSAGTGYELIEYEGEWLDQLCINELEDEKHRELFIEQDTEFRRFLESAGVEQA